MGNVTKSGIWTPDEDDQLDPDVYLATTAQSIEDGIGERLDKQEARISLRATTPEPFDVTGTTVANAYKRVPLNANGPTYSRNPEPDFAGGNHADGITIAGDVATIVTSGLYTITGQLTTLKGTFAVHSWDFYGQVNGKTFGLPSYGVTNDLSFTGGFISDTRYLAAGDRIELFCGVGTDHNGGFHVQDALLTIALQYAT